METRDDTELAPSATLGRRERAKAEKRARILAAARALFEERGFERTSMSEVARAADVAEGTVFQYAATKVELLMMVVDALWGAHERATTTPSLSAPAVPGTATAGGETADRIAELISPLVTAMRRWSELATWVAREILFGADMPHRRRVLDHVDRLEGQIAARLQDGRADASGAIGAARDGATRTADEEPGAAAAAGARLIVAGVLAELNRSRQRRIDGEDVDVVLRRLIDLVVAGAGAAR
ncbi:helix-turn-helix transcriptional regulator [Microbacterium sp. YMB-B2]|uniref:Helix-turn-helix transcriptional regulator n=1 Tax=Microbacterium tenebrionis TaxID=2830665 RepID=A0A9X1LPR0_9MICO|nr:helix-turn-helix domain-containing protein [Microbacterium tenebrionis]MCC2029438.1 helix-turn-helix transcriptional regulator [Microbacterium tenebrionis]